MKVQSRLILLKKIYKIHEEFASDAQTACRKGCSVCCTCNVTATTMESLLIYDDLIGEGWSEQLEHMTASAPPARFQPKMTINRMVALCAKGKDLPEEANDPAAGICPFLKADICSIYPMRPLGCRAMLSFSDCKLDGKAQMPPFMLSVNNVIMQYVEAVDQPGVTGNLIDVLRFLSDDAHREAYLGGQIIDSSPGLPANLSFTVLMVPPEHRQSIQPLIQSLNAAVQELNLV